MSDTICDKERERRTANRRIYLAKYNAENKEKIRSAKARYQAENKEKIRDKKKKYREENKDKERARKALYYAENKDILCARMARWRAENKDILRAKRVQWQSENKEKYLALKKRYRQENKHQVRGQHARWRTKNPDKVAAGSHRRRVHRRSASRNTLKPSEIKLLIARTNRCHWCKKPWSKSRKPTLDHVIPISKGGANAVENIAVSCKSCNCRKKDRHYHPISGQGILL